MRHTIPLISLINIRNYVVATHRRVMHVVKQISAIYMRIISYLSKAYRVNTLARFSSAGKQHREGLHTRTDVKVISSAYHRVSGYYTRSRIDWVDDRRE